jgi:hypothetical protein
MLLFDESSYWRRQRKPKGSPCRCPAESKSLIYIAFHISWNFWRDLRLVWYLRGLSWCTRGDANFKRPLAQSYSGGRERIRVINTQYALSGIPEARYLRGLSWSTRGDATLTPAIRGRLERRSFVQWLGPFLAPRFLGGDFFTDECRLTFLPGDAPT